jgi:hypothetical protein
MTDPVAALSLATAGSLALTEGVKFFYAQAGELLKWWRDRHAAGDKGKQVAGPPKEVQVVPPPVIAGGSFAANVNPVALERLEQELRELRKDLSEYAEGGTEIIDTSDSAVLGRIDALRRVLEAAYQRPLTFAGEKRRESAPAINAEIDIDSIASYVAGVRATDITEGTVSAKIKAREAKAGSKVIGVHVGRVGGSSAKGPASPPPK